MAMTQKRSFRTAFAVLSRAWSIFFLLGAQASLAQVGAPPTVTITGANPQLILEGDSYTELGATASDPEDGNLTGAIVITGVGSIDTDTPGNYTVTYTVTDSDGNIDDEDRTVTVTPNNPPVVTITGANPQLIALGGTYTELGATASDPEDGNLTGAIVITGVGSIDTNTPDDYTVTYTVTDSDGNPDSEDRIVTVTPNNPPVVDQQILDQNGIENSPFGPLNVSTNFSDPDDHELTFSANFPSGSGLSINALGVISGTPVQADSQASPFDVTITADDGNGGTVGDTVQFTITDVNNDPTIDTPIADQPATEGVAFGPLDISGNFSDLDGDVLSFTADFPAESGLAISTAGVISGTPTQADADASPFNVTITADDDNGGTADDLVEFTVLDVNTAASAVADSYATDEDTPLTEAAPGVLTNDTDPEDDDLTAILVTDVTNGTLSLEEDGSFTYTPNPDYTGPDTFTYVADDGEDQGAAATVTITVNPLNDLPVAVDDAYSATEDTTLSVNNTIGVLANDTDADGDMPTATAELVSDVTNGTLTLSPDGSFVYTANAEFSGTDSFTYQANDGTGASNTATVVITIDAINDPPEQLRDLVVPNAIESVLFTFDFNPALEPYFADNEDDELFFTADVGAHPVGLPISGTLQLSAAGVLTGVPILADTVGDGARTVTLTVADRPAGDPDRQEIVVTFQLTIQARDEIDLTLTLTADPSPASVNAQVQWAFTIANTNPSVALDSASLTAQFTGVPFTFTNAAGCSVAGQALSCTAGPIPADGNIVVSVTGQATQAGDVLVAGEVASPTIAGVVQIDPNLENNAAVTTLNVGQSFSSGPAQMISATGTVRGAAAGDLNRDGYMDLVIASGNGSTTRLYFSEQMDPSDPAGEEFRRISDTAISLGDSDSDSQEVLLVDLDGDDDLDLVVANGTPGNPQGNVVFINDLVDGQANFIATGTPLGNQASYAVAAADLTGDGLPDLVFANGSPNEVFLNQGDGAFSAAPALGNEDSRDVAIADFDGDGLPDVIFANADGASVAHLNLGAGTFGAPVVVDPQAAVSVRAADFSGDGLPDVIFGRQTATLPAVPANSVYVNTSQPGALSFAGPEAQLGNSPTLSVVVADVSLDGVTDILSLNATGTHQIFVGASNSTFTLHPEQFVSPAPTGSATGDFNGDGRLDVALTGLGGIQVFLNDGLGNLGRGDITPPTVQLLGQASVSVIVGETYADAGATATDAIDGDVTSRVTVDNPVDAAVIGTYTVTYTATDSSGNKSIPVTRTVNVQARGASGGGGGGSAEPLLILMLLLMGALGSVLRPRAARRPS